MSAAVMGPSYSPSPSSPSLDTSSPIYPDRPIRPLPKRRLRSRLSDDVAESILYPSTSQTTTPLFYFPYNYANESSPNGVASRQQDFGEDEYRMLNELDGGHVHGRIIGDSDGEDECTCLSRNYHGEDGFDEGHDVAGSGNRPYPKLDVSRLPKSHPAASSASSVDGYDSFENTNNKKKRKIPTSGMGLGSQSHLSADMANMGISSRDSSLGGLDDPSNQFYSTGNSLIPGSGTGLSGAGRGRFGRSAGRVVNPKLPLAVSSDGLNSGRSGAFRKSKEWMAGGLGMEASDPNTQGEPGIISAAIAASGSIQSGLRGQENVSLLQQQAARKASPTKTQFTFTSTDVQWPGAAPGMGHHPASAQTVANGYRSQNDINRNSVTSGTQTSPNMRNTHQNSGAQNAQNAQNTARHQEQPRKPRRSAGKEFALAARQRKLKQEGINYRNPPKREDIYICMFCEYTDIFGTPPLALIRQYEEKDRRDRLRLQEKRRLLEKAKEQAKKGKKGGKSSAKKANNTAAAHAQSHHQSTDHTSMQPQGTQSDEYFDDDYDDEPRAQLAEHEAPRKTSASGHTLQANDSHPHHHHVESGVKGGGKTIPARA